MTSPLDRGEEGTKNSGYWMPDSGKSGRWPRSYGNGVFFGHRREGAGKKWLFDTKKERMTERSVLHMSETSNFILNYACSTLVGEFQEFVSYKGREDKHTPVIVNADDIPS